MVKYFAGTWIAPYAKLTVLNIQTLANSIKKVAHQTSFQANKFAPAFHLRRVKTRAAAQADGDLGAALVAHYIYTLFSRPTQRSCVW
jgi:hypothetical protein